MDWTDACTYRQTYRAFWDAQECAEHTEHLTRVLDRTRQRRKKRQVGTKLSLFGTAIALTWKSLANSDEKLKKRPT